MHLETEQSPVVESVTEAQLHAAFDDDAGRGAFIILSREPQTFIRAAGKTEGPYILEYREGDAEHHYQVPGGCPRDDVRQAFVWYLTDDPRWRSAYPWQKIAFKPWWKFW